MRGWFKFERYLILSFVLNKAGKLCDHVDKKQHTHAICKTDSRWSINLNVTGKKIKVLEDKIW